MGINPDTYKTKLELYQGDLVLVHNTKTQNILFQSNIFSCPIHVTGQPRSDFLQEYANIQSNGAKDNQFKIVYFMIKRKELDFPTSASVSMM